jgi:hypothetical protein
MLEQNGGPEQEWTDIIRMQRAMFDPAGALRDWMGGNYEPEFGESKTHTYQWIANMVRLGRPDPAVVADTPMFAAFDRDGVKTLLAYNAGSRQITVTFKEADSGRTVGKLEVAPKTLASLEL